MLLVQIGVVRAEVIGKSTGLARTLVVAAREHKPPDPITSVFRDNIR